MFAVIYKSSYTQTDDYDRHLATYGSTYTVDYQTIEKFNTKEELLLWIERNDQSTYGRKEFEAIEYMPLKVTKKIEISVG